MQRGGKELSFNNLLDLEGALLATDPFAGEACCAIVKHTTPCGIAVGASALDAYRKALACDPVSAFGSVIAFTVPVDAAAAAAISSLFVECLVAPGYSGEALEILGRKKNLRVLEGTAHWRNGALDVKRVRGGFLVQERLPELADVSEWQVVTRRSPTDEEQVNLSFAWRAVASVKSNAIVLARDGATIGIGAGQMSRVDAAFIAVHKARVAGHDIEGAVLGSDAYFPFRDGVDQAAEAGVRAIVQPGGSVRDSEVIAAADERGTGDGLHGAAAVPALGQRPKVKGQRPTGQRSQAKGQRPSPLTTIDLRTTGIFVRRLAEARPSIGTTERHESAGERPIQQLQAATGARRASVPRMSTRAPSDLDYRPSYGAAAIAAGLVFLLYLLTLGPSTAMWDTSEYIAAAYLLGLPHPPGNPLFVLLGRVFTILPIGGNAALRVNVLAALCSARPAGMWFLITERVLVSWLAERWQRIPGGALAALIGATAFTVWSQSVVNEKVYTVSLAGVAIIAWLTVRWCDDPDGPQGRPVAGPRRLPARPRLRESHGRLHSRRRRWR